MPARSVRSAKTQPAATYVPTPRVGEASGQQVPALIPAPWSNYPACDLHQQGAVEKPEVQEWRFPCQGSLHVSPRSAGGSDQPHLHQRL